MSFNGRNLFHRSGSPFNGRQNSLFSLGRGADPVVDGQIRPTFLGSQSVVFEPVLNYPQTVSPALLAGATTIYSPSVAVSAAPATEFFDDFNRADTTDISTDGSGKWTRVSGLANAIRITSNQAATIANEAGYRAEQDFGTNNMRAEAVIPGNTSSVGPFIAVRLTDQNNFVGMRYNGSTRSIQLWKRIASALTQMGSGNFADGDIVAVEAIGNEFRAYAGVAGTTLIIGPFTHTDTVASNYAGLVGRGTSHTPFVDNFRAKPITAFTA